MKSFSFFEVDKSYEGKIIKSFKDETFNNIALSAEVANPKQSQGGARSGNSSRKSKFPKRNDRTNKRRKRIKQQH